MRRSVPKLTNSKIIDFWFLMASGWECSIKYNGTIGLFQNFQFPMKNNFKKSLLQQNQ